MYKKVEIVVEAKPAKEEADITPNFPILLVIVVSAFLSGVLVVSAFLSGMLIEHMLYLAGIIN